MLNDQDERELELLRTTAGNLTVDQLAAQIRRCDRQIDYHRRVRGVYDAELERRPICVWCGNHGELQLIEGRGYFHLDCFEPYLNG